MVRPKQKNLYLLTPYHTGPIIGLLHVFEHLLFRCPSGRGKLNYALYPVFDGVLSRADIKFLYKIPL